MFVFDLCKCISYFISEAADFPTKILPTVIASGKEAGVLRYASISHKMSTITIFGHTYFYQKFDIDEIS